MSNFLLPFLSVLFLGSLSLTHSGRAPRGWNSWDSLPNYPTEATVLDAAGYVRDYLLPSGYDTITVDEGWFSGGDPTSVDAFGRPYPNITAFPGAAAAYGIWLTSSTATASSLARGTFEVFPSLPIRRIFRYGTLLLRLETLQIYRFQGLVHGARGRWVRTHPPLPPRPTTALSLLGGRTKVLTSSRWTACGQTQGSI